MSSHQPSSKFIRRLVLSFQALFQALSRGAKRGIILLLQFSRGQLGRDQYRSRRRQTVRHNNTLLGKAGFVLPTVIMVLLVVGLFTGALIVRTGERSEDVVRSRESQKIDSIASPAVERAKAKLEYIFNRDPRFPTGVPSKETLQSMMLYNPSQYALIPDIPEKDDPYTLPDETRLDINDADGDNDLTTGLDNAWSYETDLDGDGTTEVVVYSILMRPNFDGNGDGDLEDPGDYTYASPNSVKAENLVTRTGPLSINAAEGTSADCEIESLESENGWFSASATSVRTNFQVNVFVQNQNEANRTVAALEFQQDRQLDRGNKFGVWFRYDLLLHPGPEFHLNGAIHSDGNFIIWDPGNDTLRFHLVSSPDSCIYTEDANTITLTQEEDATGEITYQAQTIIANDGVAEVDLFGEDGPSETEVALNSSTDSVDPSKADSSPNLSSGDFYAYTLNPLTLYTEDRLVSRGFQKDDGSYDIDAVRDSNWGKRTDPEPADRIRNDVQRKPYVDDLYRADDRWGPKPKYGKEGSVTLDQLVDSSGNNIGFQENGDLIEASDDITGNLNPDTLIGLDPPDEFPQEVGLDGYWERRAYVQGLRVIVGQRLELGNAFRRVPPKQPLSINFQQPGSTTPSGFIADIGAAYGNQGSFTYGWLDSSGDPAENSEHRDRDEGGVDQERDTLNHMQQTSNSSHPMSWQIELPNDIYEIELVMGDPSYTDQDNSIIIEPGEANEVEIDDPNGQGNNFDVYPEDLSSSEVTPSGSFDDSDPSNKILEVAVSDGVLTIEPNGNNAKIAYIRFLNYTPSPPPAFDALDGIEPPEPSELPAGEEDSNLRRQQKTLRDNLAAVQATAIYHYNDDNDEGDGDFPMACLATTAHPGTLTTIANSTTFRNDAAGNLETNFLQGIGTNGWEFDTPVADDDDFKDEMDDADSRWRRALQNLAYLAGDPHGAFPPVQDTADGDDTNDAESSVGPVVHPYPQLTKWGDFSNLRRVIGELKDGTDYDDLSLAAKTTLQTSSCMLGMLAYNLNSYQDYDYTDSANKTALDDLDNALNGEPGNSYEEVIDSLSGTNRDLARLIHLKEQIRRDREFGFDETITNTTDFTTISNIGDGAGLNKLRPTGYKYPILYYLFPVAEHAHDGTLSSAATTAGATEITQPSAEPYVSDPYILAPGVNQSDTYKVIDDNPSTPNGIEDGTEDSLAAIALTPRERTTSGTNQWQLPYTTTEPSSASGANLTDAAINRINDNGTDVYLPFLDKGMYNGRQLMMARVLNIDLGILRDNFSSDITKNNVNGESWLPNSGLVYAFREDALREDGIARPRVNAWTDCDTEATLTGTEDCQMDPNIPRDPPKRDLNGVSPKPVDYVADPARRPNGFRLSNGSELGREGTNRGLSFISDNPVYTLGDFNLHSLEEFTENLNVSNWGNFYTRDELEEGFAKGNPDNPNDDSVDTWRPTELLSDAITVLSNEYCDGTIEATIRENNNSGVSGCDGDTESFHNSIIDGDNSNAWILEDGSTSPTNNSASPVPIYIDHNGDLFFRDGSGSNTKYTGYRDVTANRPLNSVDGDEGETTINLVFISGLSPTRENESYGGLHNFPRFNENWNTELNIFGSIVQLNFSTYDSAGWDQENTFAPTDSANAGEEFDFYTPPDRRWGYDVALQYNPPGPIVERLLSQSGLRSELYKEIEVTDPYIQQLCRAITDNSPTCPD